MSALFIEAGNSRLKFRIGSGSVQRGTDPTTIPWAGITQVILLPTAQRAADAVAALARQHGIPVRCVGSDLPLPDVGQYPGMGLDRMVAGLAQPAPVIVVDAGTACTLTAWEAPSPSRAVGRHLPGPLRDLLLAQAELPRLRGGLILPGIRACALGLHLAAPALPLAEPGEDDPCALAPADAIANGLAIGWPGMVAAALARLRAVTGISQVIATGGDATRLAASGVIARAWIHPDLVLDGLEILTDRNPSESDRNPQRIAPQGPARNASAASPQPGQSEEQSC